MNIRILNREAFEAEYQNEPLVQESDDEKLLTADEIVTRCNALERGRLPLKAEHITAAIDVQGKLLYWAVCFAVAGHLVLPRLNNHRIVFVDEWTAVEIAVDLETGKSRGPQ